MVIGYIGVLIVLFFISFEFMLIVFDLGGVIIGLVIVLFILVFVGGMISMIK